MHVEKEVAEGRRSLLSWFAGVGDRYVAEYLAPARCDVERLRSDPCYGLRLFFRHYAYERSGAPRGFRVAAVKAVAEAWPDLSRVPRLYAEFYSLKKNEHSNPALDPELVNMRIPTVVELVERGNLPDAFRRLRLRGIGPKIRAFFLRDVVTMTQSEAQLSTPQAHLYCQPVDVWVRETVRALNLLTPVTAVSRPWQALGLNDEDGVMALALTAAALDAQVSPLRVNQGIWYFCAHAVADVKRLGTLLKMRDPAELDRELALSE